MSPGKLARAVVDHVAAVAAGGSGDLGDGKQRLFGRVRKIEKIAMPAGNRWRSAPFAPEATRRL